MQNTEYSQSLAYLQLCYETESIYYLNEPYRNLLAEVGLADGWTADDGDITITFTVDGRIGDGGFTLLNSATAEGGHPSRLDAPIPTGTTALELITHIEGGGCMQHSRIVWGDARLTSS